jgi:hypothetical protein
MSLPDPHSCFVDPAFARLSLHRGSRVTKIPLAAALLAIAFDPGLARAQPASLIDPVSAFERPFGLAGHACKQYDDTGRLFIYTEGLPSIGVIAWLQRSDGGTKANVPMPEELQTALPLIPGCLPGKHHAAVKTG